MIGWAGLQQLLLAPEVFQVVHRAREAHAGAAHGAEGEAQRLRAREADDGDAQPQRAHEDGAHGAPTAQHGQRQVVEQHRAVDGQQAVAAGW